MKDDFHKNFDAFWPVCEKYLKNADTVVRWARISEWKRLSPRLRSLTSKRNLHRLHRNVQEMIYMQHPCSEGQPHVYVLQLQDHVTAIVVAYVNGVYAHTNHFNFVFSHSTRDALNVVIDDAFYERVIKPYILQVIAAEDSQSKPKPLPPISTNDTSAAPRQSIKMA